MVKARFGRAVGVLAVMFVVAAPLAAASAAFADDPSAQSTANVGNGQELRQQWAIGNNDHITLTANIDLGLDGTGNNICHAEPRRIASNLTDSITVDGQGKYGITQTCPNERVLRDDADGETVTLTGLTHFTGGHALGHGGGLRNNGPVNVVNSDIGGNYAYSESTCSVSNRDVQAQDCGDGGDGGGVFAGGLVDYVVGPGFDVNVTNSVIHDNVADDDGGGAYTDDTMTVTGSQFNSNIAKGTAEEGGRGGGAFANDALSVSDSSFDANDAQCGTFDGDYCLAAADGGGAWTDGAATITGSTFTYNHAYDSGGGFWAQDGATVDTSEFVGNNAGGLGGLGAAATAHGFDVSQFPSAAQRHVNATAGGGSVSCDCLGGGFAVDDGNAQVTGSTFIANGAGCGEYCLGVGGGFFAAGEASVSGSTFGDPSDPGGDPNFAFCYAFCDAVGGGFYAGGDTSVDTSTLLDNFALCLAACGGEGGGFFTGPVQLLPSQVSGLAAKLPRDVKQLDGSGSVSVDQTTFTGNVAACYEFSEEFPCGAAGGGFFASTDSSVEVTASTFDANQATFDGGAFSVNGGVGLLLCVSDCGADVTMTNSTVTGNTSGFPAAISVPGGGDTLSLVNDTIDSNTILPFDTSNSTSIPKAACDCFAANVFASDLTSFGTVVTHPLLASEGATAKFSDIQNCWIDSSTSDGYNFSDDDTCGFDQSSDNVADGNDPMLGALADNGGPTQTMLPQTDSPLIDGITPVSQCEVDVDQRGVSRPQLKGCDIGAVEVRGATLDVTKVVTGTNGNTVPADGYSFDVSCTDGTTATLTVADATNGGTSATVDDIVPGSTCTVTEAAVVYTNPLVVVQPQVTYDPATGAPLAEGEAATVTVTNNYEGVNLLGLLVVQPETPLLLQPKFTG